VDDETNIRGRWSDIAFVNILDLYEEMKRSGGILTNLVCHLNIGHTFTPNTIVSY